MKMVAAARLRRSQEQILAARPFAHAVRDVMKRLATKTDANRHPLLAERGDDKIEIMVVTGDRGLCLLRRHVRVAVSGGDRQAPGDGRLPGRRRGAVHCW